MKTKSRKKFCTAGGLLGAFAIWTAVLRFIDVKSIGPLGSVVGLATLNGFVHDLTGVHLFLYTLTDWLGLIPLIVVMGFAVLGLIQWIRRRSLWKVDADILVLGGFYLAVMAVFVGFECFPVNYRPILIEGVLEASYPSSTTMLTLCVMPTAAMQFNNRMQRKALKRWTVTAITAFTILMVVARLISGVHWFTDIVGGILVSAGLVTLYSSVVDCVSTTQRHRSDDF